MYKKGACEEEILVGYIKGKVKQLISLKFHK